MKVVLDTSIVQGEGQSSFRYFSELIPRLRTQPDLSLELLPSPYYSLPSNWFSEKPAYTPVLPQGHWLPQGKLRASLSKLKWAFENHRKKKILFNQQKTIFHSFFYTLPPTPNTLVVTMALDTVFEKLGADLKSADEFRAIREAKRLSLSSADRIISISESTTKDIIEIYNIPEDRIDTIYLGVNTEFFSQTSNKMFSFEKPFFLQVGGRMHHRNFIRLAEAFSLGGFQRDYLLVCAGEPWSQDEELLLKKLGIEKGVRLIENPTNPELRSLYQQAQMLVYPSLYEGFGFPLVEAMASGIPVATSLGAGSIPEVAGNAAHYFDPRNPQDIAQKISELLDPKRAESYRAFGFENIKRFSWDKTAEKTLETYRKVFSA